MTLYIHYDPKNMLFAGFYDSDCCSNIPKPVVEITKEQHSQFYQDLIDCKNIEIGGVTITPPMPLAIPLTWDDVRRIRDSLLAQSDWTDTLSAKNRIGEELYNKWQAYRQALRDLPEKFTNSNEVVWPTTAEFGI